MCTSGHISGQGYRVRVRVRARARARVRARAWAWAWARACGACSASCAYTEAPPPPLYTQTDSPSLFPQGVEACRAELEEMTLAQTKLAADKAKVEAVIANKYGEPNKIWQLEPEKLGALLHATTRRNAMPRDGRALPLPSYLSLSLSIYIYLSIAISLP